MRIFPGILALVIGAAGCHYLFYSRAAQHLGGVETASINHHRIRLRRVNGFCMLAFAVSFAVGVYAVDFTRPNAPLFTIWLVIVVLLAVIVILALADVRLTAKLRQRK